jgi:hypothetical protein
MMNMRTVVSQFRVVFVLVLLAALGSPPMASSATTDVRPMACGDAWNLMSPPRPADGGVATFYDVEGTGRGDAWLVGRSSVSGSTHGLIQHWDGSGWSEYALGGVDDHASLQSVTVVSRTNAWAVGWDFDPGDRHYRGLVEHWDGSAWTRQPTPTRGGDVMLFGVAASSSTRAIAVGEFSKSFHHRALALRLRNGSWHTMEVPQVGDISLLQSVSMGGRRDAWAVGGSVVSGGERHVLALHWDGSSWTDAGAPDPGVFRNYLNGVDAIAPDDVWAVGSSENSDAIRWWNAWHWDGSHWTTYELDDPDETVDLQAVTHFAPDDVRMVGIAPFGASSMRAAHWDGGSLSADSVPTLPATRLGHLFGASVIGGQLWTVGEKISAKTFAQERGLVARRCPGA